ncbi:MAG: winged helix-turn-helix transcriptional regulator [Candidatus Pacearchaeota archaeon]
MDLTDKKILAFLDKNSRVQVSEIAKKLKISRQVVQYRINQLAKQGVILHFTTIVDPTKFVDNIWHIYIKLKSLTSDGEKEVIDFLSKIKNIWWIATCQGEWDLIFSYAGNNIFEFDSFMSKFISSHSNFVNGYQVTSFVKSYMFSRGYFLDEQRKRQEYVGMRNKSKIDMKDISILKMISTNSRMNAVELSLKTKLTPRQVIYRIKELVKKEVIRAFRLHLNFDKIGYGYYKVCFYTRNFSESEENKIISWCGTNPNTLYYVKKISPWTFEVEFETESYKELGGILSDMRNKFGDFIDRMEITSILKEYKGELDILKTHALN